MLSAIDQAAQRNYQVVVFTGGEPTLAGKNLLVAMQRAASHGLIVRVVTNAHWAVSDEHAGRRIASLMSAGLSEINFSTGDQHARFVLVENVIRATRAAVQVPLHAVAIMVETVRERRITKETVINHPDFKRILDDFPHAQVRVNESPWMPLSPSWIHGYPDGAAVNASNLSRRTGCDSVLATTTIEADGRMAACCGLGMRLIPELQIGHVSDTRLEDADKLAESDFLKHWIRLEGPERILAWASTHDPDIEWENLYAHRCQACLRLYKDPKVRKIIAEHYEEKIADCLFAEWLLYHDRPDIQEPAPEEQRSS